jgi:hypothetical protein
MNKILKLHSEKIITVITKLIPWLNYLVGLNLIKELNLKFKQFLNEK